MCVCVWGKEGVRGKPSAGGWSCEVCGAGQWLHHKAPNCTRPQARGMHNRWRITSRLLGDQGGQTVGAVAFRRRWNPNTSPNNEGQVLSVCPEQVAEAEWLWGRILFSYASIPNIHAFVTNSFCNSVQIQVKWINTMHVPRFVFTAWSHQTLNPSASQ